MTTNPACLSPKWRALLAYDAQLLSSKGTSQVAKHLQSCPTCMDGLRTIRGARELTKEAKLVAHPVAIDWDAMSERLDDALFGKDAPKNVVSIYAARPRSSQVPDREETAEPVQPRAIAPVQLNTTAVSAATTRSSATRRKTVLWITTFVAAAAAIAFAIKARPLHSPPSAQQPGLRAQASMEATSREQPDRAQALTPVVTLALSTVERISDDASVVLTRAGNVLPARGRLRTGARGRVDVRVARDSGFSLGADSEASWDFTDSAHGSISLERGSISANLSKKTGAAIKLRVGAYDFSGASGQFALGKGGDSTVGARVTKGTLDIRRDDNDLAKITAPGEWRSGTEAKIPNLTVPYGIDGALATSVLPLPAASAGAHWEIEGRVSVPGSEPGSLLLAPGRFVLASVQSDGSRKRTTIDAGETAEVAVAEAYFRSLETSRRRDPEAASPSAIRGVVARGERGLQRCFALADRAGGEPTRTVAARIDVSPSGRVSQVHFETSTPPAGPFSECLSQEIKGWRFPVSSHAVSVELPLKFRVRGTITGPTRDESTDYPVP